MLTPALIRGARAMLQLSQAELAEKAGISKTGLANIEVGKADSRASTLAAIQAALEAAGAEFIADGAGGLGVTLRKDSTITRDLIDLRTRNWKIRNQIESVLAGASAAGREAVRQIALEQSGQVFGDDADSLERVHDNLRRRADALVRAGDATAAQFEGLMWPAAF